MLHLTINSDLYSEKLNNELCRFVSLNTVEILDVKLDLIEDTDYNLKYLFPDAYVETHTREECFTVMRTIRDRLRSYVLYQELTPLQQYVLYNTIDEWLILHTDNLEEDLYPIHYSASDYLKELIFSEEDDPEYITDIIDSIENVNEYNSLFFDDTDFDEESLRGFVEAAIRNTDRFLGEMSLEDLDQYIEVMPIDVAEEYKAFKEQYYEDKASNWKGESMFDSFPTEILLLKKKSGLEIEITALVSGDIIGCDQAEISIEEGDFLIRSLPSNAKEFYKVIDRGFHKGIGSIKDHYQCKVQKVDEEQMKMVGDPQKAHKLFISHASKDREYMQASVEMLEDIGMPEESIVCTSVPGYGIPGGARIYDWLRSQFIECELRIVFAFSKAYFESAACLNEMGAAWVTKTTDTLLLLPGFNFSEIRGCVDTSEMGISFDSGDAELKHRLNELKDTLIEEYNLQPITSTRWERHRDKLINIFREISEKSNYVNFQ